MTETSVVRNVKTMVAGHLGLDAESLSDADNLFDLGFNSILLVEFVAEVQEAFSVELDLVFFFENRTVGAIASAIAARSRER